MTGCHPSSPCIVQPLAASVERVRATVEQRLHVLLPDGEPSDRLSAAMRYSTAGPAKRARAIMLVLTAGIDNHAAAAALDAAAAVEMLHAASLVLDDLPAMDDASLRRGKPSVHVAYGEDIAILTSIGLIARAFDVAAALPGLDAERRTRIVACLAKAIGPAGLVRGQVIDLMPSSNDRDPAVIEQMHGLKTGVLFAAALEIGAEIAGLAPADVAALWQAGHDIGLAFQGFDDLVDTCASEAAAGKPVGHDRGKATVVAVLGVEAARARAEAHVTRALNSIERLRPRSAPLAGYVEMLVGTLRASIIGSLQARPEV